MVTMGKYMTTPVFIAFLVISTSIQIHAASLQKHIHGGDDNIIENLNDDDCLSRHRARLQAFFLDAYMDQACANRAKWIHKSTSEKGTPPNTDLIEMEKDLYRKMGKPYPSTQQERTPKARKEYRMQSDDERQKFHDAINTLKTMSVGDSNYYDSLSDFHLSSISPGAHFGPAFLGWHKQFLLRMESALQAIDSSITIPYWDSTLDSRLEGQESYSVMWTDEFLGNREGPVETGPFANWRMPRPIEGRDYLWRGNGSFQRPITDEDYDYVMAIDDYRGLTWFADPYFELIHGFPHTWVGGAMGDIENSPFDPIFFMHHAFIDYMWDAQRAIVYENQGKEGYVYPSIDDKEAYGINETVDALAKHPTVLESTEDSPHYPDEQMLPFELQNKDSLDEIHMTTYYYETRPTCSAANPNCGSPFLFCIEGVYKCASKLTIGANCGNFATSDSCYNSDCLNGLCQVR